MLPDRSHAIAQNIFRLGVAVVLERILIAQSQLDLLCVLLDILQPISSCDLQVISRNWLDLAIWEKGK